MSDETLKFPDKGALNTYTYLPVTMRQFEELTNQLLTHLNHQAADGAFDAEYGAQLLTSVIHGLERNVGKIRKEELFDRCVNIISKHVSYHITKEIQDRQKAKLEAAGIKPDAGMVAQDGILPDEVVGAMPDAPESVA